MKERPILFSGEMVRAILEGRKTQTRRVIKPQPIDLPNGVYCNPYNNNYEHFTFWTHDDKMILTAGGNIKNTAHWKCPYGHPEDRLWVRETWWATNKKIYPSGVLPDIYFKADFTNIKNNKTEKCKLCNHKISNKNHAVKWFSPLFMPRWASRINLEITNIRVERVQDITAEDCTKEGIIGVQRGGGYQYDTQKEWNYKNPISARTPVLAYKQLWDSINSKRGYGWAVNPWVWVIEFRRI